MSWNLPEECKSIVESVDAAEVKKAWKLGRKYNGIILKKFDNLQIK